jgi:hypothetical protein
MKLEVPSRIRLKQFEQVDDMFAGEVYASASDGRFKFYRIGVLSDGEMAGFHGEFAPRLGDKVVGKQVKGRSEVMSGVPNDLRERVWDGNLVFGSNASVCSLQIFFENDPVVRFEELRAYGIDVVDVVYGPF